MENSSKKKTIILIISGIVVLLVGVVAGLLIGEFYARKNCNRTVEIPDNSQQIINELSSLRPGTSLSGTIKEKGANDLTLDVLIVNTLDPSKSKKASIKVPVGANDEFIVTQYVVTDKGVGKAEQVKADFKDVETGLFANVQVFQDKKIFRITLPSTKQ